MRWKTCSVLVVCVAAAWVAITWITPWGDKFLGQRVRVRSTDSASSTSAATESTPRANSTHSEAALLPAAAGMQMDWQRRFDKPVNIVVTFRDAVQAGEAGDIRAIRELHGFVVICKPLLEYSRQGGSRERHLQQQAESDYLPAGGLAEREREFDRCAPIGSAPEFADWSMTDGRLSGDYWTRLGEKLNDPLFTSFRIEDHVTALARAQDGDRESLKESIAQDVRRVLGSGDSTAWFDFGGRAMSAQISADPSIGLALVLAACDRGYDCSNANSHNFMLDCRKNPGCGAAATIEEMYLQQLPSEVNARARSHLLELQSMIQQGDWDRIERFVPLDGTAFR